MAQAKNETLKRADENSISPFARAPHLQQPLIVPNEFQAEWTVEYYDLNGLRTKFERGLVIVSLLE
jgi:hypothetical protein